MAYCSTVLGKAWLFCCFALGFMLNTKKKRPLQGFALRKIEGSPLMSTYEIHGAQHMISLSKLRFSSRLRAKVGRQGPSGTVRGQPCSASKKIM